MSTGSQGRGGLATPDERKTSMKKTFAALVAVAFGAMGFAEDVTLERSGFVRCAFGGGITAGGLINYANWSNSAQPVYSVSNTTGYVLGSRGETFAQGRWTLGGDGAGGVTATNAFTLVKDVKSQAAGTRVYLPFTTFKGAAWRTDTGKSGVFPMNDKRQGLFTGRDVKRVTLVTTEGEEISFTFPQKRFVHLSNDAAWCDAFSLRLQPPRELKAGDRIEDVFTVSVKGRALTYTTDFKTYTVGGADWVPVKMLKGVRPGGATDFSSWRLQDAPAGKYGWLRRGRQVRLAEARGRALRVRGASGRRAREVLRRQPRGQLLLADEGTGGRDRVASRAERLQHGAPAPLRVRGRHHLGDGRPERHHAQPEDA